MTRVLSILMVPALVVTSCFAESPQVVFSSADATPLDEKQVLPQWIGFRPGDGQVVDVNPPRFSWPYSPHVFRRVNSGKHKVDGVRGVHRFTLQVARDRGLTDLVIDERNLEINFFNALPVLRGSRDWYWRIGYDLDGADERWSRVRQFTLAEGAVEWDRSVINDLGNRLKGHPRIVFTPENRARLRAAADTNIACAELKRRILAAADRHLRSGKRLGLPEHDRPDCGWKTADFGSIGHGIEMCAWAFALTGDRRYLDAKKDAQQIATYPIGGMSTPESTQAPPGVNKWSTELTRGLGIFLDQCWDELTPSECEALIHSIDWRIATNLNHFSWRSHGEISMRGLAMFPSSHQYQAAMWTLAGDLAVYEHSAAAREHARIALNYLVGVSGGAGDFEAYNEGAGYGNWKSETMLLTTALWDLTVPELNLFRNPYYQRVGNFLARLTPVGSTRSSFGNQGFGAYRDMHRTYFRYLAAMTGNAQLMANWEACGEVTRTLGRPWNWPVEYAILATRSAPEPRVEDNPNQLLNVSGWVFAGSHPQSCFRTWPDNVGMTFHCRPRGGYSHSFRSENAFDLFAYGEMIAVGGATTTNRERLQKDTMSHNSILIDGRGQQYSIERPQHPFVGRVIAYAQRDGVVYFCGDATWAYSQVKGLTHVLRHVLFADGKYFVIYDDIGLLSTARPARFTWLWHAVPPLDVRYDEQTGQFGYAVNDVRVKVRHVVDSEELEFLNLLGPKAAAKNPMTGHDYYESLLRSAREKKYSLDDRFTHTNIWLTTKQPGHTGRFCAVVAPWKDTMREPTISVDAASVITVRCDGASTRRIAFGRPDDVDADIVIDINDIRRNCANNAIRDRIQLPRNTRLAGEQKQRAESIGEASYDGSILGSAASALGF